MKTITILASIFLLSFGSIYDDHLLFGTWYAIHEGKVHSVTFRQDKSFRFHVGRLNFNPEHLKARNIEMISNYEIVEGNINRINLSIGLIHPDTTLTIDLRGIYEFKNDTTLQLDFRASNKPLLQEFTSKSIIYTNNLKNLRSELPRADTEGNYIFTYRKNDKVIYDTIRPSDPKFSGIDTLYQKVMKKGN